MCRSIKTELYAAVENKPVCIRQLREMCIRLNIFVIIISAYEGPTQCSTYTGSRNNVSRFVI